MATAMRLIDEGELDSGPHRETVEDTRAASILPATYTHLHTSRPRYNLHMVGICPRCGLLFFLPVHRSQTTLNLVDPKVGKLHGCSTRLTA